MKLIDRITVNAQASVRIDCGKVLRFDPLKINGEPHDADAVFITHEHFDHFSTEDIDKVRKAGTILIAPKTMEKQVREYAPDAECVFVSPNEEFEVLGVKVTAVPSYNIGRPFHPQENEWVGYVVETDGEKVYVAGDTDGLDEIAAMDIDIALIPIGGKYTMDAPEAAEFINKMKPKTAVPIHFGNMFGGNGDDERFKAAVDGGIEVVFKI